MIMIVRGVLILIVIGVLSNATGVALYAENRFDYWGTNQ
jgi:hypothetical protein